MSTDWDGWVAACGGTEQPFTMAGETWLYMWNTKTGEHLYYNQTRDKFIENEDLPAVLYNGGRG